MPVRPPPATSPGPAGVGMLRVSSFNVNGIRACARRGFGSWLTDRSPDVVGLQEIRAPVDQVPVGAFHGYHLAYDPGELAGRNGVAIASRQPPIAVRTGIGSREFDREGRYLEVDLDGSGGRLTVGSVYLPKGGTPFEDDASLARYERKLRFCRLFGRYLASAVRRAGADGRELLVLGDFNIAPGKADVDNACAKRRSEGFLPAETRWLNGQLGPRRLVDVVRQLHPDEQGPYTWWSWRGQQWALDRGWRIDLHLATPALAARATGGGTDLDAAYEARMSDHAPVTVDYRTHVT